MNDLFNDALLDSLLRRPRDRHTNDLDEGIRLGLNLLGISVDVVRGVELQWSCTVVVGRTILRVGVRINFAQEEQ